VHQIAIDRVGLLQGRGDRNPVLLAILDAIGSRAQIPLPPRRDDLELGSERAEGQLEPDLVVALASRSVGHGIAAGLQRHLDLVLRDQRPRQGRSEQVGALVDGVSADGGEDEVVNELLPQIADHAIDRPGGLGLLAKAREIFFLPDVGGEGDDFAVVALLQPVQDDGRIEPAAVGKTNLLGAGQPNHGGTSGARVYTSRRAPARKGAPGP
jgi:hypothetical protein